MPYAVALSLQNLVKLSERRAKDPANGRRWSSVGCWSASVGIQESALSVRLRAVCVVDHPSTPFNKRVLGQCRLHLIDDLVNHLHISHHVYTTSGNRYDTVKIRVVRR